MVEKIGSMSNYSACIKKYSDRWFLVWVHSFKVKKCKYNYITVYCSQQCLFGENNILFAWSTVTKHISIAYKHRFTFGI